MQSEKPKQKRQRFTKEFKASAVALVLDEGRSATSVANSLGLKLNSVHRWVQQARADRGNGKPGQLTTAEKEELTTLRKRVRELEMEKTILKNHLARPAPSVARETPVALRWVDRGERPSAFW